MDGAKKFTAYHFLLCLSAAEALSALFFTLPWTFDSVIPEDSSMEFCCGFSRACEDGNTRKKAKFELSEEDQVDWISNLPDSILIHILSLVSTRDAIRTVLFPRFGHLWTQTYNIDFDWCVYHRCKDDSLLDFNYDKWNLARFVDFVHRALTLHKSSKIYKFRINFDYTMEVESHDGDTLDDFVQVDSEIEKLVANRERLATKVNSWIEFALKRNVEVLDLDFLACGLSSVGCKYELPAPVFHSSNLVELKLVSCDLKSSSMAYMRALKSLYLKDIVLSDKLMASLLLECPALETLSVIECYGLRELRCFSRIIKKVVVTPDILEERILKVSCPYITSLRISGWIEQLDLRNLASLHDAIVDFCDCLLCVPGEHIGVRKIINRLVHVKALTMYHKLLLAVMTWELSGLQCPSSKWETLILRTVMTKWHIYGIINLLRNSPYLKTLEIHIFNDGGLPCSNEEESWLKLEKVPEEEYWLSQGHYFACLMNSLKIVKISGIVMKEYVVKLVMFLLSKALVLEKLVISTKMKDDSAIEWEEFTEKLLKSPKASSQVVVVFAEK